MNNTRQKLNYGITAIFIWAATALAQDAGIAAEDNPPIDIKANVGILYFFQSSNQWDDGSVGGEAQLHGWLNDRIGLGLSVGTTTWDLQGRMTSETDPFGFSTLSTRTEGDFNLIPVGASLLVEFLEQETISLVLDAGVHYVFIDSDADIRTTVSRFDGDFTTVEEFDADDAIIAAIKLDLHVSLTETLSVFAGVGYQTDLDKSETTVIEFGEPISRDLDLDSYVVNAGISIDL